MCGCCGSDRVVEKPPPPFFFLSIFLHGQTSINITMNPDFFHAASLIKEGRKEEPFHYMTVINERAALNELQADEAFRSAHTKLL